MPASTARSLPRSWTDDRARCRQAGVPATIRFATTAELAKRLLARAFTAGVPARWVVADSFYGRAHHCRRWLEAEQRPYVVGVLPAQVVAHDGRRPRAAALAASLPARAWVQRSSGLGS
jgi:SRSO17 transposase